MNCGEDELDEIISALAQWCKENDRWKKAPRDVQSDVSINDGGRKGGGGQGRRYKNGRAPPLLNVQQRTVAPLFDVYQITSIYNIQLYMAPR